jgi:hypothetical protein
LSQAVVDTRSELEAGAEFEVAPDPVVEGAAIVVRLRPMENVFTLFATMRSRTCCGRKALSMRIGIGAQLLTA